MGTWFGLAETNRTEGFICFFLVFLQWKFWSGESCVDASVSGEEPFLDLGKIFLPCSRSSDCLGTCGLPWLQKVFSFWPFLYSGGSCCCSQRGSPSAACTGSEWHLVLWHLALSLLGMARSAAVQVSWDVPSSAKHLRRAQLFPGAQPAVTSSCCWLHWEDSWCFQTCSKTEVVAFILFALKPINKEELHVIPSNLFVQRRNLNTDHGCFK